MVAIEILYDRQSGGIVLPFSTGIGLVKVPVITRHASPLSRAELDGMDFNLVAKKAGILDSGLIDHELVAGVRFELTTFGL